MSNPVPHLTDDQLSATLYLTVKHINEAKKTRSHKVIVDEGYLNTVKLSLESVIGKRYSDMVFDSKGEIHGED